MIPPGEQANEKDFFLKKQSVNMDRTLKSERKQTNTRFIHLLAHHFPPKSLLRTYYAQGPVLSTGCKIQRW